MRFDLTARLFPLIFDKYAYSLFERKGFSLSRKKVHIEYKAMIIRTPALPKNNPFIGNVLMGCYALSFCKAYPDIIDEELFRELVLALCNSKPMINGHKKEDAFDEKMLLQKEEGASLSQNSDYEMDWRYRFQREKDCYDLIYTRCGLCQLGRRENCFHLIRYLCEADFITYDLMGADLKRTQTLASGGTCCDFHVSRKDKKYD